MANNAIELLNEKHRLKLTSIYVNTVTDWRVKLADLNKEFGNLTAIKSFDADTVISSLMKFEESVKKFSAEVERQLESATNDTIFFEWFNSKRINAARKIAEKTDES